MRRILIWFGISLWLNAMAIGSFSKAFNKGPEQFLYMANGFFYGYLGAIVLIIVKVEYDIYVRRNL